MQAVERALDPYESALVVVDRASPLNFSIVVELRGPITETAARRALEALQARHPLLRVRVDGARFTSDGVSPLPLRLVTSDRADAYVAEADAEVMEPFPEEGPLFRAVLLPRGDHATVLLTFHHAIGDGMSGAYLARDFVTAAAAVLRGEEPSLAPLPLAPPIHARLPKLGLRGVARLITLLFLELWLTIRYGKPMRLRRTRDVRCWERRARLLPRRLDPATLSALIARARKERTTVHGALSAALLLAVRDDSGVRAPTRVLFGSPVDVRSELTPPAGEEIGFYVSMIGYRGVIQPDVQLWDLARAVKTGMDHELAQRGAVVGLKLLRMLVTLLGGAEAAPRVLAAKLEDAASSTTGITNLGRLTIATEHPPLAIEGLHIAASPSALGDFLCTVVTVNDTLFWNFVWPDPVLDETRARAIADDAVARLHAAIQA